LLDGLLAVVLDDHAVAQTDDPRGRGRHVGFVGYEDDRATLLVETAEDAHDLGGGRRVEVAGRFVGQHDGRVRGDRSGHRDPLLLAAGQLGGQMVDPVGQPDPA
jgi:hypothetical protein